MAQGFTRGTPIDTDPNLALDSDLVVPSQRAVKDYIDTGLNTKQDTLTLTTTGTSGAATLIGATLNIPQYSGGGGGVSSVGATLPITSSGGSTPVISTSMATNKLIGRGTAGTGPMEEITLGTGLSLSGTTLSAAGVFQHEIHVSQVDGNDTTGNGILLNPVASITYALTLLTGSRKTIVVHPGTYSENVTIANTNTTIATTELTGANTLLSGTLTIGTAGSGSRISGLKMTNLVISGTAQAYISNCTVDTQVTKSSSGFVEIINTEMQCTLGIQISGSNITIINGNKNVGVAVSNASAQVIIKGCNSVVTPSASAGNLAIVDCIVTALGGNGITITNPSTTLTLLNSQVLVTAGNNVAPISVAGIYSIINTVYDKPTSTFTGISTNSIDYFQYINADKFIKQGGTASEFLMADGSVTSGVGSCGVTFDGGGQVIQTKTAYVQIPYNGTLTSWSMVADQAGACTIAVSKSTFAGFPPTSPVYSVNPAIPATNQTATNPTPTYNVGMATITAGDVLKFDISAITTITWVNLSIKITKT